MIHRNTVDKASLWALSVLSIREALLGKQVDSSYLGAFLQAECLCKSAPNTDMLENLPHK